MYGPSPPQKELLLPQQPKNRSFISNTLFTQNSQQRAHHTVPRVPEFFRSFNIQEKQAKYNQKIFTTHHSLTVVFAVLSVSSLSLLLPPSSLSCCRVYLCDRSTSCVPLAGLTLFCISCHTCCIGGDRLGLDNTASLAVGLILSTAVSPQQVLPFPFWFRLVLPLHHKPSCVFDVKDVNDIFDFVYLRQ